MASTMAGRVGFSVLCNDVDLDERAGKKKSEKLKPKIEEASKRSSGNKPPSKKKKATATAVEPGVRKSVSFISVPSLFHYRWSCR